ncbi:sugar ABC transporter substrate-binding protein [Oceanobacillus sp. ISL-73]|uniref:ABC transporter substrate-binding protein n=1 Tax=Oceanobacillus sp. ISL-73 TaxID=2819161 RepID=UPI0020360ECA|nr:sugar ABC transporter substrate-binding protein [Oceanobacillus sp. ISL-73]
MKNVNDEVIRLKKRMLFILLLTLVSLLAACSLNNAESEEDKLTIAVTEGNIGQFNQWKARSSEFTEETGIEVEFIGIPYESLLDRILAEGISGKPTFDLVTHLDVMGPSLSTFLEPLNEYADADFFDRFPDSIVELSTFEDKIYSVPLRANAQILLYRKDVFEDLGIDPPKTWEDLEAAGDIITEETDMSAITPYFKAGKNGQNLSIWATYLWGNGAEILDENNQPVFNSPEGIAATEQYIDLLRDGLAPKGAVSFDEQESRTHFKQGRSAMWIGWWWVYSDFNESDSSAEEVRGNVGFTTVPTWEGGEQVSGISTFPIAMMESSKKKEEAWKFIEWLSRPENEKSIVMDSLEDKVPADQFSTDIVQLENLRDEELNEAGDNLFNIGGDSFENAKIFPTLREWPQVSTVLSRAISDIATGEDAKTELDAAAEEIERLLED